MATRTTDKEEKKPFHVVVAEGLIKQLEAGTAPWQKPWEPGGTGHLPMNPTTGKRYKGINSIQLMMQGRSDPRWLTYKQADAAGAQVRRGERGTLVQYWKFEDERTKTDEQGRPVIGKDGQPEKERFKLERPKVFHAVVFNAEQIDGLPAPIQQPMRWDAVERAEAILKASGADISHAPGDRAFYRPSTDSITMPYREQFKTADAYYATALHELGHWTGHESRLGRDLANPFGSEAYAKEELRAEIASMLMGDELAIGHDPGQHAAYVKSWVKVLKDDPMEILRASADAEKIHSFVMAFEQQQVQSTTESQAVEQPVYARTAALYQAMNSADEAFRNELVRVYGEDRAGDARYKPHHEDAAVQRAADNFVKASADWHAAIEEARTEQAQEARMTPTSQRQFIDVPFKQKDEAKKLGAKWDRAAQSWYVPPGVNPDPFAKWAQKGAEAPPAGEQTRANTQATPKPEAAQNDRVYLAVPYTDRMEAKAAGAAWDKAAKSWYVGPNCDMTKLERWRPENVKQQQDPAMTPRDEFADALRSMQCVVEGEHPIMDGQRHRIKVIGDSGKEAAGFYVGHLDGHPAGYIKNNRSGEEMRWKSTGYSMNESDKAKLRAEAADKLAERAAQQEQAQNATADRLAKQLNGLKPVEQPTAYMQGKGIAAHAGAFTDAEGQKTYIPAIDGEGKVWTMQYIQEDGTKRFAKDSRKEGCFHVVGGGLDSLASAPALVIAEGYATAATLAEGLGHATVAAFDSGNLKAVAVTLNAKFPDKPIIIAGDDDRHLPMTLGNNPGREKAIEAAAAVGGQAVFPVFAPGEAEWPEGVKPITPETYKKHQAAATALEAGGQTPEQAASLKAELLSQEQLDALAKLKRHTDFNDLASRSTLGREGITRQASAATSLAIEQKHELVNKQQQARAQDEPQEQQRPRRAAKIG
jgi:putative DNA primase/helicase